MPGQGGQGQEPTGQPRVVEQGDNMVFTMNETAGMDLTEFIKYSQQVTERRFVFNTTELQQAIGGPRVSFLGTMTFPKANFVNEFYSFFVTMLYMKGFALLSRGSGNTEIQEIVFMTGARQREVSSSARLVPVDELPLYRNQTGVPIMTTLPLKNINSNLATNALRPFFAASSGAAGAAGTLLFGTAGNTTSMLLQGFGPQVYDAAKILELVDKPVETPDLVYQLQRLEYAAPEELVEIVTEILESRQRQRAQALQEAAGQPGAAPVASTNSQSQVKVMVVNALKALMISGTGDQVNEALELISRLDVKAEPYDGQAAVLKLNNVLADDLRTTLSEFVRDDQQAEQQAQAGQAGAGRSANRPRPTVIRAHKESNSLLVSASQTKYQQILKLIDELDRRQPQVLIETAVVELTTGDLSRFGVELGLIDLKSSGKFTRGFGFTNSGLSTFQDTDDDGLPDTRLPDFTNPLQGLTGGIIDGGDFAVPLLINALATDDRANILSLPSVVVNNNTKALIKTSEQRPTTSSSQTNSSTLQSNGAPRDAGITLNISPTISPNNYLRLSINLNVSRFVGAFDPNSPSGGGITLSREIQTQVTMPSGDTMVIGGIIDDQESSSNSGIPFLKDIPLLGWFFRNSQATQTKTNLYFFVTPTILDEDDFDDLWQVSLQKKMEAERYIGTRRLRIVDRKWNSGATSQARLLEDAGTTIEDLDAQGENELPYYHRPDRQVSPLDRPLESADDPWPEIPRAGGQAPRRGPMSSLPNAPRK